MIKETNGQAARPHRLQVGWLSRAAIREGKVIMILYLVFIAAFALYKAEVFSSNLNENYLSKENTDCIKGIFMFLVIASHAMSYIEFSGEHDRLYLLLQSYLGQGIVAMFLFYSGYGVAEAIKKKRLSYIKTIPIKRVLVTGINFDLAVILGWLAKFRE